MTEACLWKTGSAEGFKNFRGAFENAPVNSAWESNKDYPQIRLSEMNLEDKF